MSNILEFDDDTSKQVEGLYTRPEMIRRRTRAAELLDLRWGESVIDIGCGPGFLCQEMSGSVGDSGKILGVDASASMLGLARKRCADIAWVDLEEAFADSLPASDESFDAAISTQVFEYIEDVPAALAEVHRVLRSGGRTVILATDWRSLVWRSNDDERMNRIIHAFDTHLADPCLPRRLGPELRSAGFEVDSVDLFTLLNTKADPNTYAFSMIFAISRFVVDRGLIDAAEAQAWADDLLGLAAAGEYFFSLNQYFFVARKRG
jgi:arsenite methyltransferase